MVVVAPPYMVNPPPSVPLPMVDEARTWRLERRPREVRDEVTTFEARVVPVKDPAGADPDIEPVRKPVTFPMVATLAKRFEVEAFPEA